VFLGVALVVKLDQTKIPISVASDEIGRLFRRIDQMLKEINLEKSNIKLDDYSLVDPCSLHENCLSAAKRVIELRDRRQRFFEEIEFGEPQWDILLDLFVAKLSGQTVSVSSACIGAKVPATTALRHLSTLVEKGVVHRVSDQQDARRVYVTLSKSAEAAMLKYLRLQSDS
jgi:DNA-binding MarR family transcriptional regulator